MCTSTIYIYILRIKTKFTVRQRNFKFYYVTRERARLDKAREAPLQATA